jgi:hypothetical protein
MIRKYEEFSKILDDTHYVTELTEDRIFEIYQSAIRATHKNEFKNFN